MNICRLLLFLLIFIIFGNSVSAQCGTDFTVENLKHLQTVSGKKSSFKIAGNVIDYIPVKINIITKGDGTGGVLWEDVMTGFRHANNCFRNANIQFYLIEKITYIKSSEFYEINEETELKYAPMYDMPSAINIYYGGEVISNGNTVGGYAYFPGGPLRVMINNSAANSDKTLAHELGHFYGLAHTFENSNHEDIGKRELVTRGPGNNCNSAGDMICDTPADPFIAGQSQPTFPDCFFSVDLFDANGDRYDPMLNNMMSYYGGCTQNIFTDGQLDVIKKFNEDATRSILKTDGPYVQSPSNLSAIVGISGISLSWEYQSINEAGYVIEISDNVSGIYSVAGFAKHDETTFLYKNANPFSQYSFRVKALNSKEQYSNIVTVTTQKQYCIPETDFVCDTSKGFFSISMVNLQGETLLESISACEPTGYRYYPQKKIRVFKGESYIIKIFQASNGTGTIPGGELGIWIDFDENGYFREDREFYLLQKTDFSVFQGQIKIPEIFSEGIKRMRVRLLPSFSTKIDSTQACTDFSWGETEDYDLQVEDYPDNFPVKLNAERYSNYQIKLSWESTSTDENTICFVEKASAMEGPYQKIDSLKLSEKVYYSKINSTGKYYYRIRRTNDRHILSNKVFLGIEEYITPFRVNAYAVNNVIFTEWKGDTSYFPKAILQKCSDPYQNHFFTIDTIFTNAGSYEDYTITSHDTIAYYRFTDMQGDAISAVQAVKISNRYCIPYFNNSICYPTDWQFSTVIDGVSGERKTKVMIPSFCEKSFTENFNIVSWHPEEKISFEIHNDMHCMKTLSDEKTVHNNVTVWMDFDENMSFDDDEKIFEKNYQDINCYHPFSITIPENTDGGPKRVRVITTPYENVISGPCDVYEKGKGGDFYIRIEKENLITSNQYKALDADISVISDPAQQGYLEVITDEVIGSVKIYNEIGQFIYESFSNKIHNLNKGLYFVLITTEEPHQIFRRKVFVH